MRRFSLSFVLILLVGGFGYATGRQDPSTNSPADGHQQQINDALDYMEAEPGLHDPTLLDPPLLLTIQAPSSGAEFEATGLRFLLPERVTVRDQELRDANRTHLDFQTVAGQPKQGVIVVQREEFSRAHPQSASSFNLPHGPHEKWLESFDSDLAFFDWAFAVTPDQVRRSEGDLRRLAFAALNLREQERSPTQHISGEHFTAYLETRTREIEDRLTAVTYAILFDAQGSRWGWMMVAVEDLRPDDLSLSIAYHMIGSLRLSDAPATAPAEGTNK